MERSRPISGHDAPRRGESWAATYRELVEHPTETLDAAGLETLAVASYLMGDDDRCAVAWEEAHRRHAESGSASEAARCSFWLAFCFMMRGHMAQAGGWLGRSEAMLADQPACSASGLLLIPALLRAIDAGDPTGARSLAARMADIATEVGDEDLAALARLGDGQACIALGDVATATARFDDAMLTVSTGEVGPISRGVVYCAVILECMRIFDLRRAAEWTDALSAWCEDEPEMVPYRGQCLVHRSQLLQASGDWTEAADTADSARRRLTEPPHPALGLAHYQTAELHRLLGAFDEAAEAYRRASAAGHEPMPGLALLNLSAGDFEAATAGIRRALHETTQPMRRPGLLAAAVEIFRAANDLPAARTAADELVEIAATNPTEVLDAMAGHASGSVTLAEGDPAAALSVLRDAHAAWSRIHMPYEAARTSMLLGLGCLALGDRSSRDPGVRECARRLRSARSATRSRATAGVEGASRRPCRRSARARPNRTAVEPRTRGAGPCRDGEDQPRDRGRPRDQPAHREQASGEHLLQVGCLGPRPRPLPTPMSTSCSETAVPVGPMGSSGPMGHMTHRPRRAKWDIRAMRRPHRDSYVRTVGECRRSSTNRSDRDE